MTEERGFGSGGLGFGNDWIWIIVVIVLILLLCPGIFGGFGCRNDQMKQVVKTKREALAALFVFISLLKRLIFYSRTIHLISGNKPFF